MSGETADGVADGWYVVRPAINGGPNDWETVYYWDSSDTHLDRASAIAAGWEGHGHDDWNLGRVEGGALVWWGWMTEEHEPEDRQYVAQRLGLPCASTDPAATS